MMLRIVVVLFIGQTEEPVLMLNQIAEAEKVTIVTAVRDQEEVIMDRLVRLQETMEEIAHTTVAQVQRTILGTKDQVLKIPVVKDQAIIVPR